MVGLPSADGLTPEQLVDEDRPDRPARAGRAASRRSRRSRRPGATRFPPQEYDLKGRGLRPATRSRHAPSESPVSGTSATVDGRRRSRPSISACGRGRTRGRSSPLPRVRTNDAPGSRCSSSASGSRDHGIDGRDRTGRPATCCSAGRRGPASARRGAPPRTARPIARGRAAAGSRLDPTVLAIQGPPGSGKTYSGARMICALLAAGQRVGVTANSHKVIGNLLDEVSRRRPRTAWRSGRSRTAGRRPPRAHDERVVRARTPRRPAPRSTTAIEPRGRHGWLWARRRSSRRGRRPVRRRGGPDLAGERRSRCRRRPRASSCSATRSSSISRSQGTHPPGAERSALAHVLGRADDARRTAACSSNARGGCTRRSVRLHVRGVLRRPAAAGSPPRRQVIRVCVESTMQLYEVDDNMAMASGDWSQIRCMISAAAVDLPVPVEPSKAKCLPSRAST